MKLISSKQIAIFFSDYPLIQFDKNEVIIQAGEEPEGVYFLRQGQVKKYDISDKGEEVIIDDISPGSFFSLSSTLNKTKNRYFYETTSPAFLHVAPAENVRHYIEKNPAIAHELLRDELAKTDIISRRMAHLMGGTSYSRTLFELLVECKKFGVREPGGSYSLTMNEDDLAHHAGLTRETVSRELGKLKKLGFISIDHRTITIHSLKKLENELGDTV